MNLRTLLGTALMMAGSTLTALAQNPGDRLPVATVKTPDGKQVSTADITNPGKPMVVSMWATWCKPCIRELSTIKDSYSDWQSETGVKVVAISIDDARNAAKVGPFTQGEGWEYEVYIDENGDLKRLLNVNSIPHTFLLDGAGNIVWQHNGYASGDEDILFELIQKLAKGETIEVH